MMGQPKEWVRGHHKRAPVDDDGRKRCGGCGEFKDPSEFLFRKKHGVLSSQCKPCLSATHRAYAEVNRERIKAQQREYRAKHAEKRRVQIREWREAHPKKCREYGRKNASTYRARSKAAFVEYVDHRKVWDRDDGMCGICGDPVAWDDLEVDHIWPRAKNGVEAYFNMRAAHEWCNQWKSDRLDDEIGVVDLSNARLVSVDGRPISGVPFV